MVLSSEPKTTTCIFPPSTVELAVCLSVIPWWRRMEQMQQSKFCVIPCQDSVCTSLGAHSPRVLENSTDIRDFSSSSHNALGLWSMQELLVLAICCSPPRVVFPWVLSCSSAFVALSRDGISLQPSRTDTVEQDCWFSMKQ